MRTNARTLAALLLISLSCGGTSGTHIQLPALPRAETRATLVGPRCAGGDRCQCRDLTSEEAEDRPGESFKRFEVRVGPTQNALWVTVDDMILYKSRERATECFYVDLIPGKHPVRVHGKEQDGLGVQVEISELSGGGPWWYPTFELDCGAGGLCDLDGLRKEQERIRALDRGIQAPCGSVRIQRFEWRTGTMPDTLHPGEVVVDFVLNVYKFATDKKPGDQSCRHES